MLVVSLEWLRDLGTFPSEKIAAAIAGLQAHSGRSHPLSSFSEDFRAQVSWSLL
jgi:hypothetical protein